MKTFIIIVLTLSFFSFMPSNQHEELGKVNWLRDYEAALTKAKNENKQVLILFQEVPGCATCRNYGQNVLSHPLMVEAIENEFVPLAIFNNKGSKDAEVLKKYNEPSWNNPVVRIVTENGENVTKRIANDYSAQGLSSGMIAAMKKSGIAIPEYLELLDEELKAESKNEVGFYKMYCFWTGEKQLGSVSGVLNTESGFIGSSEVVRVTYNPEKVDSQMLSEFAEKNKMETLEKGESFKLAEKDLHYYLQNSDYKYLPLTELQKTKINAALGRKEDARKFLSPKQKSWLSNIVSTSSKGEILFSKSFENGWQSLEKNDL